MLKTICTKCLPLLKSRQSRSEIALPLSIYPLSKVRAIAFKKESEPCGRLMNLAARRLDSSQLSLVVKKKSTITVLEF